MKNNATLTVDEPPLL